MNWATLPEGCPAIFDRIIRHAAAAQNIYDNSTKRLMRIREFGKVCSQWKGAILSSGDLFKSPDEFTFKPFAYVHYEQPWKELVGDGYLGVMKKLVIDYIDKLIYEDYIDLFCDAENNKIEEFCFTDLMIRDIHNDRNTYAWLKKMANLFRASKNARSFTFRFDLTFEYYGVSLWELLCTAVHCNERPKEINYECKEFSWHPIMDWASYGLIENKAPDSVGSIKFLRVVVFGDVFNPPNFSCFGKIDTISIEFHAGKLRLRSGQFQVSEINAEHLNIEWHVGAWISDPEKNELNPWQPKFEFAREQTHGLPNPSVQTVDITLIFTLIDIEENVVKEEKQRFTATFDCGTSPWGQVREWLTDVEEQCVQLLEESQ